jgi:hypothetical protein
MADPVPFLEGRKLSYRLCLRKLIPCSCKLQSSAILLISRDSCSLHFMVAINSLHFLLFLEDSNFPCFKKVSRAMQETYT